MADVADDYPAAAQAVLDAARDIYEETGVAREVAAAALRAVVKQCVYTDDFGWEHMDPEDVLAIAAELDGETAT